MRDVFVGALCAIGLLLFFSETYPASPLVFWNETAALVAFGISWLTRWGLFILIIGKNP
jgi:hypothetical protein